MKRKIKMELHKMRVRDWPEFKRFKPHQRCEGTRWLQAFGKDRMASTAWDACEVPNWMRLALWKLDVEKWDLMMNRCKAIKNWKSMRDIRTCDYVREMFGNPFRKNGIKKGSQG